MAAAVYFIFYVFNVFFVPLKPSHNLWTPSSDGNSSLVAMLNNGKLK